ncbi:uncharacterized protein [Amphiura filiformis]|uniref:uncharacterized protein n=1 Tax=Amphiura filiformis TaxID=82378 RepID=UPI003B2208AB
MDNTDSKDGDEVTDMDTDEDLWNMSLSTEEESKETDSQDNTDSQDDTPIICTNIECRDEATTACNRCLSLVCSQHCEKGDCSEHNFFSKLILPDEVTTGSNIQVGWIIMGAAFINKILLMKSTWQVCILSDQITQD